MSADSVSDAIAFLVGLGFALATLLALVGLLRARRRQWRRIHLRSESHTGKEHALLDWLTEPTIVRTMIQTGTATAAELQVTLRLLPAMSETQVNDTCRTLLRDKRVRRVVVAYVGRSNAYSRAPVRRALREWANIEGR